MTPPRCPHCQFSYAWDGDLCHHCGFPRAERRVWGRITRLVSFTLAHPQPDGRQLTLFAAACVRRVEHLFPPHLGLPQLLDAIELLPDGRARDRAVTEWLGTLRDREPRGDGVWPEPSGWAREAVVSLAGLAGRPPRKRWWSARRPVTQAEAFLVATGVSRAVGRHHFPHRDWRSFPLPPELEPYRDHIPYRQPRATERLWVREQNPDPAWAATAALAAAHTEHENRYLQAQAAEEAAQCDLYRDILGGPAPLPTPDPRWRTSTVLALSRVMVGSGNFSAMPILADALQDAGCDDPEILDHCRADKPHARGCWVLRLVLGGG